jgi:signal transduction histidine kinase/CheY-like chemotaxis protein
VSRGLSVREERATRSELITEIRTLRARLQRLSGENSDRDLSQPATSPADTETKIDPPGLLGTRMLCANTFDSLGVFAGGVAHDFNNLLTPILGNAKLALLELPPNSRAHSHLDGIQKAALRATALTNQMLAYAGTEPLASKSLNLSALLEEMEPRLRSAISSNTTLELELAPNLNAVDGDPALLSQIVMNLVTNATESLGPEPGQIFLRTGEIEGALVRPFPADSTQADSTTRYGFFEVEDTGDGMDGDTRARIFDPFFTTKFSGRGLGLTAVLGVVQGHRGIVEIETEPGSGTRFRVLFPICETSDPNSTVAERTALDWRGQGTVLIVDDDEGVRDFIAETLERAALTVLCAADGYEGIELLRKEGDRIRVVLLDRTMPSLSGEQTFDQMRRIRPDTPIVLVSGFTEERISGQFAGKGLSGVLQKPFMPEALLDQVRKVIEGAATG